MEPRLDIINNDFAMKVVKYFVSANKVAADSTLPAATQELVKIRASQINGCGFCLDMHTKDAAEAGETPARLNLVACWREATVFTRPSAPRWNLPNREPASPTAAVSRMRYGRTQPSTTTMNSS